MEVRALGSTGLRVSALGIGTATLGGIFGRRDSAVLARTLDRALDLGINLVDTAPSYGAGVAEEVLGEVLRGRRERVVLSTKVGCWAGYTFDFTAARIRAGIDESLRRLRTDRVELLFLHDIEHAEPERLIEEAGPALRSLREEGKVRAVGVSGYPVGVLGWAVENLDVDVVLSYCRCALHDVGIERLLSRCAPRKVGVISASPVAMRLLTSVGPPKWHPASPELKLAAREAAQECERHGVDLAQLALQFAFHYPGVDATITGTGDVEHLEQNVRACATPPDPALLRTVREIFSRVRTTTWDSGLAVWQEVAPEPEVAS